MFLGYNLHVSMRITFHIGGNCATFFSSSNVLGSRTASVMSILAYIDDSWQKRRTSDWGKGTRRHELLLFATTLHGFGKILSKHFISFTEPPLWSNNLNMQQFHSVRDSASTGDPIFLNFNFKRSKIPYYNKKALFKYSLSKSCFKLPFSLRRSL